MNLPSRKSVLSAAGLAVGTLLVLEFAVRLGIAWSPAGEMDPIFGRFAKPYSTHVFSREGYSRLTVNGLGFFDDDPLDPRPPLRGLLIGDSFAEARQVWQQRRFDSVAESQVEGLEICNSGHSGWGPPDLAAFALHRGHIVDPDVLIIQYNDLDLGQFFRRGRVRLVRDDGSLELVVPNIDRHESRLHRLGWNVVQRSALAKLLKDRFEELYKLERLRLEKRFASRTAQPAAATASPDAESAIEALVLLHETMAERYPEIVYVYIPTIKYDSIRGVHHRKPESRRIYQAFAERVGVVMVDPTDAFLEEFRRTRQPSHGFQNSRMGKGHLNNRGHRILGEQLAEALGQFRR